MIFKIQRSIVSNDGKASCLIYNENRDVFYQTADPEEVKPLVKLLGKKFKGYYDGFVSKKTGKINIKKQVQEQDW